MLTETRGAHAAVMDSRYDSYSCDVLVRAGSVVTRHVGALRSHVVSMWLSGGCDSFIERQTTAELGPGSKLDHDRSAEPRRTSR